MIDEVTKAREALLLEEEDDEPCSRPAKILGAMAAALSAAIVGALLGVALASFVSS